MITPFVTLRFLLFRASGHLPGANGLNGFCLGEKIGISPLLGLTEIVWFIIPTFIWDYMVYMLIICRKGKHVPFGHLWVECGLWAFLLYGLNTTY